MPLDWRKVDKVKLGLCQWFLMCVNKATGVAKHPVLGDVPICDRCQKKLCWEGHAK